MGALHSHETISSHVNVYLRPVYLHAGTHTRRPTTAVASTYIPRNETYDLQKAWAGAYREMCEISFDGCPFVGIFAICFGPYIWTAISLIDPDVFDAFGEGTVSTSVITTVLVTALALLVGMLGISGVISYCLGNDSWPTMILTAVILYVSRNVLVLLTLGFGAAFYACCAIWVVLSLVLIFYSLSKGEMGVFFMVSLAAMCCNDFVVGLSLGIEQGNWWLLVISVLEAGAVKGGEGTVEM